MPKKKLQYITTPKLIKAYKRSKILTIVQTILVGIMLVFAVLTTLENGVNPFTFLPLIFTPMIIAGFIQMNQFKKELKSRDE